MTDTATTVVQQRLLITDLPGPESRRLHKRRSQAVSDGVASALPVYAARAGGGVIVDVDGNHLIDLVGGIGVSVVGNSNAHVVEALTDQAQQFTHTAFMVVPYRGYVEVCERLNELTPGTFDKRSALFNSGSEAVENAVKVARRATGRSEIVVLEHAYHGRTNLTLAMTAKASPFKLGFGPLASGIHRVPASYPYRDGRDAEQAVAEIAAAIETRVGPGEVAAIIVEPIQGEGGFIVPAPGFLPKLHDYARSIGALLVADEVQSGFGRTGAWFAAEHDHAEPDLVVIGKGVGGGLPLSAVTGRAELMNAVQSGGLGGTYGGNPVVCAAALGAIEAIEQDDLLSAARRIEQQVRHALQPLLDDPSTALGDVRGRGAMMALEFVKPDSTAPNPAAARAIAAACHQQGVIVLVTGTYGNVIRLLPPLVIDSNLLDEGLQVLTAAISDHQKAPR